MPTAEEHAELLRRILDLEKSKKINWPAIWAAVTIMFGVINGFAWVLNYTTNLEIDTKINSAKNDVMLQIESHASEERDKMAKIILDSQVVDSTEQKEIQVLTTHSKAFNELRNVQWDTQHRLNIILWDALQGLGAKLPAYPSAGYYLPSTEQ